MILVDTSVWIDQLRNSNSTLVNLLNIGQILVHPFVIGELALGNLRQRDEILDLLNNMPSAKIASNEEVLGFINHRKLYGLGIGYIDAHLLTSVRLMPGTLLWTNDKRFERSSEPVWVTCRFYTLIRHIFHDLAVDGLVTVRYKAVAIVGRPQ